ncbi:MAG: glutamine-hydrolyzing carbamoyl-phosphate synthase small subunit [Bradyrhizobiaceae bacterium]|nr:glutamine-hydrolyzing carbamoyl-phosphate synthase small subunit [Bradyrhizobiaceae bacterium]
MAKVPAVLALENGHVVHGTAIGAIGGESAGELVFNTAMMGYQEILTDPSYYGQTITFTYPHIGNYGVSDDDWESGKIQAAGLVVAELSRTFSNRRAVASLGEWLEHNNVAGIEGVDTRALVRMLRTEGAMRCVIVHGTDVADADLVAKALAIPSMEGQNLTPFVSTRESYVSPHTSGGEGARAGAGKNPHVVALDFGSKRNIIRRLNHYGCDVTVVPGTTTSAEVLALNPDGIFLSNGPGDPAAVSTGIATIRELLGVKPMFGICLGHQMMALAVGGKTYKLKFGHRGANHPVKNLRTGSIEITSQNHGFAVDASTLPENVEVTHVNLNDDTCAGIAIPDAQAFAVQYHPEAAPGPHDSDYLFHDFVKAMG